MSGPQQFNQLLPNPVNAALQGFQGAQQIKQNQFKQRLLEQQAQQTQTMNQELATLSEQETITSDDIGRAIIKYPSLSDDLRKAFGTMNSDQQQNQVKQLSGLDFALQKGDVKSAKLQLEQQRDAAFNSGDKQREAGAKAMLLQLENNPKSVGFSVAANLASVMGVKAFSEYRKNITPKASKSFRTLTTEEKAERGLNVDSTIQVDQDGKIFIPEKGATAVEKQKLRLSEADFTQKLRKEFTSGKLMIDAGKVNSAVTAMDVVWDTYQKRPDKNKSSKNALDQALIVTFNKMLDPGSVVRESEYARTSEGQAVIAKLEGLWIKLKRGGSGLTDAERQEMVNTAQTIRTGYQSIVDKSVAHFTAEAKAVGLDPDRVVGGAAHLTTPTTTSAAPIPGQPTPSIAQPTNLQNFTSEADIENAGASGNIADGDIIMFNNRRVRYKKDK